MGKSKWGQGPILEEVKEFAARIERRVAEGKCTWAEIDAVLDALEALQERIFIVAESA